jgi:hypothetical protein
LGESTNPDKDMLLTANHKGEVHYVGEINIPSGMGHSLIAVIRHRKIEDEIRVYIKATPPIRSIISAKNRITKSFLSRGKE